MEKIPELKPKPEWSSELAEITGSLDPKIQDLIVRVGVRIGFENEENCPNNKKKDQIVVLSGEQHFETTDFKFANFNESVSKESQIIHELLHPIGWQIAKNINPNFEGGPFDYFIEMILGGIHRSIDDSSEALVYTNKSEIINFYFYLFQAAIKQIYQKKFSQNKEIKKSLQSFLYLHYQKLKSCDLAKKGISQGCGEIIANYNYSSDEDISTFGSDFWQEIQNINKEGVIKAIKEVIFDIKNNNKFDSLLTGKIPDTVDCLVLLNRYSAEKILEMIYLGSVDAPGEIWDKYEQ